MEDKNLSAVEPECVISDEEMEGVVGGEGLKPGAVFRRKVQCSGCGRQFVASFYIPLPGEDVTLKERCACGSWRAKMI